MSSIQPYETSVSCGLFSIALYQKAGYANCSNVTMFIITHCRHPPQRFLSIKKAAILPFITIDYNISPLIISLQLFQKLSNALATVAAYDDVCFFHHTRICIFRADSIVNIVKKRNIVLLISNRVARAHCAFKA